MSPRRRSRGNPGGIYPNNAYRGGHLGYVFGCEKVTDAARLERNRCRYFAESPGRQLERGICTALSSYNRSTLRMTRSVPCLAEGLSRMEKIKGHLEVPFDNVGHI